MSFRRPRAAFRWLIVRSLFHSILLERRGILCHVSPNLSAKGNRRQYLLPFLADVRRLRLPSKSSSPIWKVQSNSMNKASPSMMNCLLTDCRLLCQGPHWKGFSVSIKRIVSRFAARFHSCNLLRSSTITEVYIAVRGPSPRSLAAMRTQCIIGQSMRYSCYSGLVGTDVWEAATFEAIETSTALAISIPVRTRLARLTRTRWLAMMKIKARGPTSAFANLIETALTLKGDLLISWNDRVAQPAVCVDLVTLTALLEVCLASIVSMGSQRSVVGWIVRQEPFQRAQLREVLFIGCVFS
ncbi:hypothetical protein BDP55DRAFT_646453 [Colletotrichum godetiae]|uniref:Secreted protein n=1 Tax=Colletotrichum godetiae TaxID=1209918 RepID=A0AAJ0AVP9_9PEZI|nr:uncharacterized protein BDP55DRAFT_646453 [Colletotrichum godetiae]KAK1691251.1 hypothetical protein BDP55DRAFT_646453 [Colletotrichum godetiae]